MFPQEFLTMVTRGVVTVKAAKDAAFQALLSACKDMDANIEHSDSSSCTIDGKSGTMWLQNRFSFKFHARLLDAQDGVLVEVFDFSPFKTDRRFMDKLFEKLKRRLSISEPSYADVQRIWNPRPASSPAFPGLSADTVPTPTESTASSAISAPFMLDEAALETEASELAAKEDTVKAGFRVENPPVPTQMGGLTCPNCSYSNPAGSAFCSRCRSKLGFICPKCTRENPPSSKFCRHCGARL